MVDFYAKLAAVLLGILGVGATLSRAISILLDKHVEKWSNSRDGEEHWFAKNDQWYKDRGHDKRRPPKGRQ